MQRNTPLLDQAYTPEQLRALATADLPALAEELRQECIRVVAQTGGHLGAGLGVVELSVALHYVFNTPDDKLIWDVGHQAYPHKILTGRRDKMHTLRQGGGLSGFTKRGESDYDPFGAGHSSTSISAALGMAIARDRAGKDNDVIAVIGDGAMSAGMAYEALNNAGALNSKLIVVLNDNDMSIAPPVGAMSGYLSRLISSRSYRTLRRATKKMARGLPSFIGSAMKKTEQYAKHMAVGGGNFFEEMGFYYVGPVDGHNLEQLIPVLQNIKQQREQKPILLHVVTEKGKGFDSPESSTEKFHAVKQFDPDTKIQKKSSGPSAPSYTNVFADSLIKAAEQDDKIMGITAAMPSGTGMDAFAARFPDRMMDVGIAEQHAVTFAAGLAAEGLKPFCAIYSTFLQRAYDQLVHDVCIQNLPVRFAIDRAGLVGADGPTHAGSFDVSYLCCLPNMVVMAPSDEAELAHMVHTAALYDDGPIAFRYPRGSAVGVALPETPEQLEIGKGRVIRKGKEIAVISLGTRLAEVMKAAGQLETEHNISITVVDARFAKPVDAALLRKLADTHTHMITIEENAIGGFAAQVAETVAGKKVTLTHMHLPDIYQQHDTAEAMYKEAGLDADGIVERVLGIID